MYRPRRLPARRPVNRYGAVTMFGISKLSAGEKIARGVFRGSAKAIGKLGDSPTDDMKGSLRMMFVREYRRFNWDAQRHLPDAIVSAAFDDAYRVTPTGSSPDGKPYGERLRKNFIDIVGCYEDGEFGCW